MKMSSRLDQETEARLQPIRMATCKKQLENLGYRVISDESTKLLFLHKGCQITFFPYSGWHSGKTIKDGRGFNHLLKQLVGK